MLRQEALESILSQRLSRLVVWYLRVLHECEGRGDAEIDNARRALFRSLNGFEPEDVDEHAAARLWSDYQAFVMTEGSTYYRDGPPIPESGLGPWKHSEGVLLCGLIAAGTAVALMGLRGSGVGDRRVETLTTLLYGDAVEAAITFGAIDGLAECRFPDASHLKTRAATNEAIAAPLIADAVADFRRKKQQEAASLRHAEDYANQADALEWYEAEHQKFPSYNKAAEEYVLATKVVKPPTVRVAAQWFSAFVKQGKAPPPGAR